MISPRRWTVRDSRNNLIYLTEERWQHILDGHPEMEPYESELEMTIKRGARFQDVLNPQKYRYVKDFDNLPYGNNHIVAIVLFRFQQGNNGYPMIPNNYIVTAFSKYIP